jgi:hypothetical protein
VATNGGFVTNFADAIGYDQRSKRSVAAGTTASQIMGMFTPAGLPVLSGLAAGFAVCDHWYSSVPTETFPNRALRPLHRRPHSDLDGSQGTRPRRRGVGTAASAVAPEATAHDPQRRTRDRGRKRGRSDPISSTIRQPPCELAAAGSDGG